MSMQRFFKITCYVFLFIIFGGFVSNWISEEGIFNLTFYETINLIFIILNVFLLIEIYNFFIKKAEDNRKKEEFIFKQLELLCYYLQEEKLIKLKSKDDYKKYLMIQRKITNHLNLIEKICTEYNKCPNVKTRIEKIKNHFTEYTDMSAEKIQDLHEFNKESMAYEKILLDIHTDVYSLQGVILNFNSLNEK